jgi:hypothetical protein
MRILFNKGFGGINVLADLKKELERLNTRIEELRVSL